MSNSDLHIPDIVTSPQSAEIPAREPSAPRDLEMRIGRDGTWYYRGSAILRPALVKLFASVLRRDPDGSYWLVTPVERGRIEIEDAPFIAIAVIATGAGPEQMLRFTTNVEDEIVAGPAHPIRVAHGDDGETPRPYVLVRPGLEALISRPVYYQLAELAVIGIVSGIEQMGVWSGGGFFPLGAAGASAAER